MHEVVNGFISFQSLAINLPLGPVDSHFAYLVPYLAKHEPGGLRQYKYFAGST